MESKIITNDVIRNFSDNYPVHLLKVNNRLYMCCYLGMQGDRLGNCLANFLVNGIVKSIYLHSDEIVSLAYGHECDESKISLDKAEEALDKLFREDPAEYVNDWELLD